MVFSKQKLNLGLGNILSQIQLQECLEQIQIIEPKPGQLFWTSNVSNPGIYLILAGKIRLLDQKENLIASIDRGWFGQISLFPEANLQPYMLRASLGLKLGFLDNKSLQFLFKRQPELKNLFYRQALQWDLLLLSDNVQNLLPILSFLQPYPLTEGVVSVLLPESSEAIVLRRGKILHTSGVQLIPGKLYQTSRLPQDGEWAISKSTELFYSLNPVDRVQQPETIELDRQLGKLITPRPKIDRQDNLPPNQTTNNSNLPLYFPTPKTKISQWWQQWTKRYPFLKQQSAADCGVACLTMVGKYWGKNLSINQLRNVANVDRSGTSIKGLIVAAESIGFMVRPIKADLPALAKQNLPAIVHWEGNHYIVVYRITKQQVIVSDPQRGRRFLTRGEFVTGWTGYTVLLTPTAQFKTTPEAEANLWKYTTLLKPYWLVLLEIFAASLIIQILGLFTPIFTQIMLDRVVVQRSVSTLIAVGTGLIIFRLFGLAIKHLRKYLLYHTANKLDLSIIVGFISHAFKLPLSYFETRYVGDITSRISENRKIRSFMTGDAITTVLDVLNIFVYLSVMFWYSWQMSLLALTVVPVFALVTFVSTPFLVSISRENFNSSTKERSYLIEALTGIGTIKAMGVERTIKWRWEDLINESIRINFTSQMIRERIDVVTSVVETLVSSFLLIFGVWQVIQNQLTIGQLIAFNMLVGNVISPFKRLISLWNDFQEIRIAIERTDDVITAPVEETETKNLVTLPPIRGDIRFENVTFRYNLESEINTLENLSFKIKPGQTIALVGRSGSGKTTIAKLLLGLYIPTSGKIFIDGNDLTTISLHSLRQQAGVVDQDTFFFGGTIRENLTIANPNASQGEIKRAARLAGAAEFIEEMPLKYETPIGEGGGLLSGGQRQRLAIARALLGNPHLLILDEATSNLDAESERIIQNNFNTILKNQTTLVIAHRLSTIRNADLILVMDRGLLIESGTHQQLMEKKGQYYYLNQQQLAINN
jgi:ATP-binding cassette subfamily B protein